MIIINDKYDFNNIDFDKFSTILEKYNLINNLNLSLVEFNNITRLFKEIRNIYKYKDILKELNVILEQDMLDDTLSNYEFIEELFKLYGDKLKRAYKAPLTKKQINDKLKPKE